MITDERMIRTPKPVRLEGGKIVQMPFKKDIKKKLRAIFAEAESELEQERASGTVAKPKKPPRPGTREHPVEGVKSLDRHLRHQCQTAVNPAILQAREKEVMDLMHELNRHFERKW